MTMSDPMVQNSPSPTDVPIIPSQQARESGRMLQMDNLPSNLNVLQIMPLLRIYGNVINFKVTQLETTERYFPT
jgi:hypothetical protein